MGSKIVAILLFGAVSLTGCATDTDYYEGPLGIRPAFKPAHDPTLPSELGGSQTQEQGDHPTQDPDVLPATPLPEVSDPLDGRLAWAEEIETDDGYSTVIHYPNYSTGIDTVHVLDEAGAVTKSYTTRFDPTEIDANIGVR